LAEHLAGGPDGSLLLPLRQTERTTAYLRPTQQVIGVRDQGGGESHKVIYVNSAGALLGGRVVYKLEDVEQWIEAQYNNSDSAAQTAGRAAG